MGGLSDGEMASSYVTAKMSEWFKSSFSSLIKQKKNILEIRKNLDDYIHMINDRINLYSSQNGVSLGTTMTALIYFEGENKTLTAHVGDTRLYKITDDDIQIMTHDHSVVGEEVIEGIITEESANNDERQNQLTKCLGADFSDISYDYIIEEAEKCCYMLCSDGFRKKITMSEIHENLKPSCINSRQEADEILRELTELGMERMETDNITAVLLKVS